MAYFEDLRERSKLSFKLGLNSKAMPALLEVAERLLADHRRIEPHHEHICELCKASVAAIKKARGEQ